MPPVAIRLVSPSALTLKGAKAIVVTAIAAAVKDAMIFFSFILSPP